MAKFFPFALNHGNQQLYHGNQQLDSFSQSVHSFEILCHKVVMLSDHNLLPWYLYLVIYFNENSQVLVNAIILILTVAIVRLHNIVMESITVIHMYH